MKVKLTLTVDSDYVPSEINRYLDLYVISYLNMAAEAINSRSFGTQEDIKKSLDSFKMAKDFLQDSIESLETAENILKGYLDLKESQKILETEEIKDETIVFTDG